MSNENNNELGSNEEMVTVFKENDKTLFELVNKIKNIYANTLMLEKREKIDALRKAIVTEDIACQLRKMEMINATLNELE